MKAALSIVLLAAGLSVHAQAQAPRITALTPQPGNQLEVRWDGGLPPFQLVELSALSPLTTNRVFGPVTTRAITVPGDQPNAVFQVRALGEPPSQTATYRLTFTATWSAATHPTNFPPNPHFSPLVGSVHNRNHSFWSPGTLSTPGIKNVAETGGTFPFTNEIAAQIIQGTAASQVTGAGIDSPGATQVEFTASQTHPLLTLVTMIAPSPDWFIGVHDLPLFADGDWVDELAIDLFPYDAGTDSGLSYLSPNQVTNPPAPIQQITGFPFLMNGEVNRLGAFFIQRID